MSDKYEINNYVVGGCFLFTIGNYFRRILLVIDLNKIIKLRLHLNYVMDIKKDVKKGEKERKEIVDRNDPDIKHSIIKK